ncbi:MAG: PQQ-dependent sugar dehydrogenase, partial [Balneolales bacterium]|nr:PQQ-dependent sugar dehydrogenase [Balneolales bacterium]
MKYLPILVVALSLLFGTSACVEATRYTPDDQTPAPAGEYFTVPVDAGDVIEGEDMNYQLDKIAVGLGVVWGMAFLPDGIVLATERAGDIRVFRKGELQNEPLGGVPDVYANGQGGLLDIVLHPDYENNGWIYLSYSKPGDGGAHTAVMRAKLDGNSLTDQEVIFSATPNTTRNQHFGSRIAFDNDGYLYLTIGDRGVMNLAQDLTSYAGKTLRLHDDGRIPSDNPFVGQENALDEIFTYGNRNQQGMILHPETGEIWSHEHGPRGGDEINIMRAGLNYGWPVITYGVNYNGSIISEDTHRDGMEQPVLHWTPSIAPSGMAYVSSDRYPAWKGDILSGSLSFQFVNRTVFDGETVVKEERLAEAVGRVRDVRQAPDGFIYFSTDSGR